jgi:hypothetical protein
MPGRRLVARDCGIDIPCVSNVSRITTLTPASSGTARFTPLLTELRRPILGMPVSGLRVREVMHAVGHPVWALSQSLWISVTTAERQQRQGKQTGTFSEATERNLLVQRHEIAAGRPHPVEHGSVPDKRRTASGI